MRAVLSVVVALLLAFSGLFITAQPAHAGTHGVGYDIGQGWLGAYQADDGRQVYCIDLGLNVPFSPTSGPHTVTSLDSLSSQQLAELNYVLARWGQSGDPNVTAAVAMYVWGVADPGVYNSHGMSGDAYYIARAPSGARPTIQALLAQMRAEAPAYAVTNPSLSLSIEMADQYTGTLTVAAHPSHLQGTANLSGAAFGDGSTSKTLGAGQFGITGTPADGAPWYQIGASMSVDLDTVGDTGTALHALGTSLLANAETRVIFRQETDQLGPTAKALGLTSTEQSMLPTLGLGQALWRIKDHSMLLQTQLHPEETVLFDTTSAMSRETREFKNPEAPQTVRRLNKK
ncbi:MAG TPA: hypothetical protein VNR37_09285 [Microbacteriaceae bacterium]|nr:hypothetical protein [Microbacteriaceae bacterium]